MLKITKRQSTVYDYVKMKNIEPFKNRRSKIAKPCNFSLIFGESAIAFAGQLKKDVFTESEVMQFIKDIKWEDKYEEIKSNTKLAKTPYDAACLCAATFLRESFFNSYKGLGSRLTRELAYAKKNGFVRSWHGPVRHLPELLLMKFGANGLLGVDKELHSRMFSGLKNDSGNSTIQTLEVVFAQLSFIEICYYIKKWKLKSRLWNQVHDSGDYFIYVGDGQEDPDNEEELVLALIHHCDTKQRQPFYGIPQEIDGEIADLSTSENRENGHWYHSGDHVKFPDLDKAIENWNSKHQDKIEFKDLDPLTWEL